MRFLAAIAAVPFLFTFPASAAAYYVATNGNDGARGSVEAPFRTITRASSVVKPGDVVNVRGGTYSEAVRISAEGTAAARIIVRAMPGEAVILDGRRHPASRPVVELRRTAYVELSGFEVRNSPYIGIVVWHARHTRVLDNHVHHTRRNGIYVGGDALRSNADITVARNRVHDTVLENRRHNMRRGGWAGAIVVSKTERATIADNRVWNNDGEGVISRLSDHAVIRNNEIFDNFSAYLYLDNARFVTADRNRLYSTGNKRYFRDGKPAAGIAVANETNPQLNRSSDNVFTNNVVTGTRWGFYYGNYESGGGLRNTKVANNTFSATTDEIIRIEDDSHANSVVEQNTFRQTRSPAVRYSGAGGVTFRNNTWYGSAGAAAGRGDIVHDPRPSR